MDSLAIAFITAKYLEKVIDKDQNHRYILKDDVAYRGISTEHFPPFDYEDEYIKFTKTSPTTFDVILKAGGDIYDGTSLLPDKGTKTLDALFRAHFIHDAIYERAKAICEATGVPMSCLFAFADDCLKIIADAEGANKAATSTVHTLVRSLGMLYHKLKSVIAVIILCTLVAGCYTIRTTIAELPEKIEYEGPIFNE